MSVDEITLNFSPQGLLVLNVILGLVMFGVALNLRLADFHVLTRLPRAAAIGLTAQFVLLPALTFGLASLLGIGPSLVLGMLLVAACPGGNISNFFTQLGKGNAALSVCLSAVSTAAAVVMTPLNFGFWASLHPEARVLLRDVALDPLDLAFTVFILLGLPLAAGLWVNHHRPAWADRLRTPMRRFSLGFFALFVALALAANWQYFLDYIGVVVLVVAAHNALALGLGYTAARAARLDEPERRAVAIEIGIQNSGLGLLLIFNFFDGLGGMAIVAAWWGIWHIVTGLGLALFWSQRAPTEEVLEAA